MDEIYRNKQFRFRVENWDPSWYDRFDMDDAYQAWQATKHGAPEEDGEIVILSYIGQGGKVVINGNGFRVPGQREDIRIGRIATGAFVGCDQVTKVSIYTEKTLIIQKDAFKNCTNLKEVTFPHTSLKDIYVAKGAFAGCTSLAHVDIPTGSAEIMTRFFQGFSALVNDQDMLIVNNVLLRYVGTEPHVTVPEHVVAIDGCAFCGNPTLESIAVGKGCKVHPNSFWHTTKLTDFFKMSHVVFKSLQPVRQLKVAQDALSQWEHLEQPERKRLMKTIKTSKKLKHQLFQSGDSTLVSILLQEKKILPIHELERYLNQAIKDENTSLTASYLAYKNRTFDQQTQQAYQGEMEQVAYGVRPPTLAQLGQTWAYEQVKGGLCITGYHGTAQEELLPGSTQEGRPIIAVGPGKRGLFGRKEACEGFRTLHALVIQEGILYIGEYAFLGCENLHQITLPETLEALHRYAFWGCKNLVEVTLPAGLKVIQESAFYQCSNLESIALPQGLEQLAENAFSGCDKLKTIILPKSLTK